MFDVGLQFLFLCLFGNEILAPFVHRRKASYSKVWIHGVQPSFGASFLHLLGAFAFDAFLSFVSSSASDSSSLSSGVCHFCTYVIAPCPCWKDPRSHRQYFLWLMMFRMKMLSLGYLGVLTEGRWLHLCCCSPCLTTETPGVLARWCNYKIYNLSSSQPQVQIPCSRLMSH
jgi:hypothetical protein